MLVIVEIWLLVPVVRKLKFVLVPVPLTMYGTWYRQPLQKDLGLKYGYESKQGLSEDKFSGSIIYIITLA